MRVGRGDLESQPRPGVDVARLVLFLHQVAIQVMEVTADRGHESTEDGQVLRKCIGEIVRWSTSCIEAIDKVPEATRAKHRTTEAFDFNEDNHLKERIISGNMEDYKEVDEFEIMDPSGNKDIMANGQTTSSISGLDGLTSTF